jgi:hypothetical protein
MRDRKNQGFEKRFVGSVERTIDENLDRIVPETITSPCARHAIDGPPGVSRQRHGGRSLLWADNPHPGGLTALVPPRRVTSGLRCAAFFMCEFHIGRIATIVDDRSILETQRPEAGTARCENTVSVRSTIIRGHSPIASSQRHPFVQRLDSIGHDRRCLASSLHGRNKSMADDVPTWRRRTQWYRCANLLFESRTINCSRTDQ